MNQMYFSMEDSGCYPKDRITTINDRIWFVESDGVRVVYRGWNTPLHRVALEDEQQVRYVAVSLRLSGHARQHEIADAFKHSVESQRRWERRYEKHGLDGLRCRRPSGPSIKVTRAQEVCVTKWFAEGLSNSEMARRLGVSEATARRTVNRLGLERQQEAEPETATLPFATEELPKTAGGEADPCPVHSTLRVDDETDQVVVQGADMSMVRWSNPLDRSLDRLMACIGLIDDADPIFTDAERLPRVGIFLAVPLLVKSGIIESFMRIYHSIGPAFYGLRTTVVALIFLTLLRIKRPENLKEYNPADLGRLLGLDRAPEVKTLRRKLQRLATRARGRDLIKQLCENRMQENPDAIGFLYLDGHVKQYHGKYELGKAYATQRRLAVPAATSTWVNDVNGDPVFVVQSELNEGLSQMLEPVLAEVRALVGTDRKLTVVFDRGGWNIKLFYRLIQSGCHIITYRKQPYRPLSTRSFKLCRFHESDKEYTYQLHDARRVRIGKTGCKKGQGPKYLWLRQVTRLRDDGGQTAVITDRTDLAPESVLYFMFNRWRQENFFKYMNEEFAFDSIAEYGVQPVSAKLDRPNPDVNKLDGQLRKARTDLARAQSELGELLNKNKESSRPTIRGFKIAHSRILRRIRGIEQEIETLKSARQMLPKRVPASDVNTLKKEARAISDAIKMTAYQIESDLVTMLSDSYARSTHEGRTLLHAALQSSGNIEVTDEELRITLAAQSSPHKSRAVSRLCEKLNKLEAVFPGTKLRLRLGIEAS